MLRVSPGMHISGSGAVPSERTIMGIVAVAEELTGSDELDELYRLDASEPEPEPTPEPAPGEDESGTDPDGTDPGGDEPEPEMPHG